jgi:hypothetical protein
MARRGDGTLLTGVADDTQAALRSLREGGEPVFLAYTEEYMNERDAERRSASLRDMSEDRKEQFLALANMRGAEDFAFGSGFAG